MEKIMKTILKKILQVVKLDLAFNCLIIIFDGYFIISRRLHGSKKKDTRNLIGELIIFVGAHIVSDRVHDESRGPQNFMFL